MGTKRRSRTTIAVTISVLVGTFASVFYILQNMDITLRTLMSVIVTIILYYLAGRA